MARKPPLPAATAPEPKEQPDEVEAESVHPRPPVEPQTALRRIRRSRTSWIPPTLLMVLIGFLFAVPMYWLLMSSVRPSERIFADAGKFIPSSVTIQNYVGLFAETNFTSWFRNSFILAAGSTLGALVVVTMAAYPLARMQFRFRNAIFVSVLVSYMLPFHLLLIPLFVLMIDLNLIDKHLGIMLPLWAHPFGLFFMRQYMLSIPQDVIDAAKVDGASDYALFWRIVVPLVKPALATLAILFSLESWNDLLWPLIVMRSPENIPLAVGIQSLLGGQFRPRWDLIMAASVLATVPVVILFFALRKTFLGGFGRLGTGAK